MSSVSRLVVVGASLTAVRIAEEARRTGFTGSITLIGSEDQLPYDRPPLSKHYLTSEEAPPLDGLADLEDLDVTVLTSTTAQALDARQRRVRTTAGDVGYDALVIATGAVPRRLEAGAGLAGVTSLRTAADAAAIRQRLQPGANVVVVGAGFIGGEVASSARALGASVTLVEAAPLPLVGPVGSLVAERLAYLHRQNDVDLLTRTRVREIVGNGCVEKVVFSDGTAVAADLVVVGIGVEPATAWLKGSGVAVSDGVACTPYLESTVPGVYAAGDVARWVNAWSGRSTRLEHWTSAGEQAAAVVRNALTEDRAPCSVVPYFWSEWYGHRIQFLGEPADEVELTVEGGPTDPFLAMYRYDGQLVGGFGFDRTGPLMRLRGPIRDRSTWESFLSATPSNGRAGAVPTAGRAQ